MAQYEFLCKECNNLMVINQGWDEERPTECTQVFSYLIGSKENGDLHIVTKVCGGPLIRVWSMPHVIYRAGGFQTTDKRLEPKESDYD